MCGIYLITNKITNKVYVGQSINIERRWAEHKARAFNPNNNCFDKPLYRSMRKHGIDNFEMTIIYECEPNELNEKEAEYIIQYDCITPKGYNVQTAEQVYVPIKPKRVCSKCGVEVGYGTKTGLCFKCHSETTRKVERPTANELKTLLENNTFTAVGRMFGISDNAVRKWCKDYGLPYHSSDYQKPKTKEEKIYKKRVLQLDKDTDEILNIFESTNDAARSLGKSKGSHITEACQGKIKTAYGYKWQYAEK